MLRRRRRTGGSRVGGGARTPDPRRRGKGSARSGPEANKSEGVRAK